MSFCIAELYSVPAVWFSSIQSGLRPSQTISCTGFGMKIASFWHQNMYYDVSISLWYHNCIYIKFMLSRNVFCDTFCIATNSWPYREQWWQNIRGGINENSLQHEIVTVLKYMQTKMFFGEIGGWFLTEYCYESFSNYKKKYHSTVTG